VKSATFYVVIGARYYHSTGQVGSIRAERLTQKPPSLDSGEVAVRIKLSLDDKVFKALLDAGELVVEPDALLAPQVEQLEPAPNDA